MNHMMYTLYFFVICAGGGYTYAHIKPVPTYQGTTNEELYQYTVQNARDGERYISIAKASGVCAIILAFIILTDRNGMLGLFAMYAISIAAGSLIFALYYAKRLMREDLPDYEPEPEQEQPPKQINVDDRIENILRRNRK